MSSETPAQADRQPLFLADHAALDFLNTVMQVNGSAHDLWQSDEDVWRWLVDASLISPDEKIIWPAGALLNDARHLREIVRTLVVQKKSANTLEPQALNAWLAAVPAYQQLVVDDEGIGRSTTVYASHSPARLLAAVAELAVTLLIDPHVELLRTCEHPDCTLWFYDRTKSHRRRWCSMALCGNRAKVARFRQQQR